MKAHESAKHDEVLYAINKTARMAFRRAGEEEEWQPVDMKSIEAGSKLERAGHQKIGNNWFSLYKEGAQSK